MKKTVNNILLIALFLSVTFAYEAILKSVSELPKGQTTIESVEKVIQPITKNSEQSVERALQPIDVNVPERDPETVAMKGMATNSRFPSVISYGEGSTGLGGFIFNEGDSAAVWFRPDTDCTVDGVQLYFHDESELIGTDVTIVVREVLDVTSDGIDANGVYDFSYHNESPGDFMGATLFEYTFPLTPSDVYPTKLDINFDTSVDVGSADFAIQVVGNMGGDGADLLYYAGVGGAGTSYNHGFKYYATGASYCDEGCWVPRLNFIVDAKVDYYGDPPPFVTEFADLPDVYASCDPGPYFATVNIMDVGTATFTGSLTSVLFIYDDGTGEVSTELIGAGVDDVFIGVIPAMAVGTTVNYWWIAVDNGDENPDGGVQHTVDFTLSPKSFTVQEYTEGADVLVLDDGPNPLDATYAARVGEALYNLGYSIDFWNTKTGGLLTACELSNYENLVVIQGLNSEGNFGVDGELEANVMAFMDNGGNLLFSSADYIYGVAPDASDWTTADPSTHAFLANYLHVMDFWSDANYFGADYGSTDTLYTGIEDNILSGNIDTMYVHSPEASNWADEVFPDDDSEAVFNVYSTTDEDFLDAGGVMYEGNYKMAFFPWHLEGIDDDAILYELLDNTMNWFEVNHVPVISAIDGASGTIFTSDDVAITATAADEDGDAFVVNIFSAVDDGEFVETAMTDNGDGTFTATLSGQAGGSSVVYYLVATDDGGSFVTADIGYFVYAPSADVLFVLNNEMNSGGYPGLYYLYDAYVTGSLFYWPDFWDSGSNGLPPAELLVFYDTVIEITTTTDYPFYGALGAYYDVVVADWLALGNKNYVLAGDETFGIYNTSWADVDFEEGSFFHNMGVATTMNDLAAGGVTQLLPIENDVLSGELFTALGADTLLYDPDYEIEFANWLDGVVPTADATVAFTDLAGNAVGVSREWDNGNKTVFLGFDPLSLNGSPYVWWGAKEEGSLKQALNWFGFFPENNISDEVMPESFELHSNYPNPFNPVTTIRFDIPEATNVDLKIYNLLGAEVATLHSGYTTPDTYTKSGMEQITQV